MLRLTKYFKIITTDLHQNKCSGLRVSLDSHWLGISNGYGIVLKFLTFYSIPFLPIKVRFFFLMHLFHKILVGMANSVDPDQTAVAGAV